MGNLFDVIKEYQDQLSSLMDQDLPNEVVLDTVEGMQGDVEKKLRAVVAYALQIKADAEARKQQATRMAQTAKTMEARYESLMMYAQVGLMNSGLCLPLVLPEFTLNLAKNPPSLSDEVSEQNVPARFAKRQCTFTLPDDADESSVLAVIRATYDGEAAITKTIDRRELLKAVKADPDGCKEFARLSPQSYRLSVR